MHDLHFITLTVFNSNKRNEEVSMAQSLFEKISTLALGKLHAALDEVMQQNSVPVYEQYLRRLEEGQEELLQESAQAIGRMKRAEADMRAAELFIQTKKAQAKGILTDTIKENDHVGLEILKKIPAKERELEELLRAFEEAKQQSDALKQAIEKVNETHAAVFKKMQSLRVKDATTKAKEKTSDALDLAASLVGSTPSVDDLGGRIDERSYAADARLEQSLAKFKPSGEEDVQGTLDDIRARELLAELTGAK